MSVLTYKLATVIVCYNSINDIARSVKSAIDNYDSGDCVVVVDNASTDGSVEVLKRLEIEFACLHVVYLNRNIGFGPANNVAFNTVVAEWYFLLNVDAWLIHDSGHDAIKALNHDPLIVVCGLPLIFPDGSPQTFAYSFSSGFKWVLQLLGFRRVVLSLMNIPLINRQLSRFALSRNFVESQKRPTVNFDDIGIMPLLEVKDVDWVCGAAMLIRGGFIAESGGFDPNIFLYGEDEDFCITAHKHGRRVVTCSVFPVVHVFGWGKNSFNPVIAGLKYDSLKYFIRKNITNPVSRVLMNLLLPFHVYGFSSVKLPLIKSRELQALLNKIDVVPDRKQMDEITHSIFDGSGPFVVGFINAHAFNLAVNNSGFMNSMGHFDLLLRDGIGMEINLKMLGMPSGLNMNGTDYIPEIISEAIMQGCDIALFGTEHPYNQRVAQVIRDRGGVVVGVEDGFHEDSYYVDIIRKFTNRNVLVVLAMGMPKQERVAMMIGDVLSGCDNRVIIVCGGAILDFMGGKVTRAPEFFRRYKSEWIYRLCNEPRRLFRRYVLGNVLFLARSLAMAILLFFKKLCK